jgi:hypothetical protein
MTINRSTLLDLPLPVTGTEDGTWGDVTNNGLTQYLDIAVAGALEVTSSVTLATTEGDSRATNIGSTTAQHRTLHGSCIRSVRQHRHYRSGIKQDVSRYKPQRHAYGPSSRRGGYRGDDRSKSVCNGVIQRD